jgi:hypothetical protein
MYARYCRQFCVVIVAPFTVAEPLLIEGLLCANAFVADTATQKINIMQSAVRFMPKSILSVLFKPAAVSFRLFQP